MSSDPVHTDAVEANEEQDTTGTDDVAGVRRRVRFPNSITVAIPSAAVWELFGHRGENMRAIRTLPGVIVMHVWNRDVNRADGRTMCEVIIRTRNRTTLARAASKVWEAIATEGSTDAGFAAGAPKQTEYGLKVFVEDSDRPDGMQKPVEGRQDTDANATRDPGVSPTPSNHTLRFKSLSTSNTHFIYEGARQEVTSSSSDTDNSSENESTSPKEEVLRQSIMMTGEEEEDPCEKKEVVTTDACMNNEEEPSSGEAEVSSGSYSLDEGGTIHFIVGWSPKPYLERLCRLLDAEEAQRRAVVGDEGRRERKFLTQGFSVGKVTFVSKYPLSFGQIDWRSCHPGILSSNFRLTEKYLVSIPSKDHTERAKQHLQGKGYVKSTVKDSKLVLDLVDCRNGDRFSVTVRNANVENGIPKRVHALLHHILKSVNCCEILGLPEIPSVRMSHLLEVLNKRFTWLLDKPPSERMGDAFWTARKRLKTAYECAISAHSDSILTTANLRMACKHRYSGAALVSNLPPESEPAVMNLEFHDYGSGGFSSSFLRAGDKLDFFLHMAIFETSVERNRDPRLRRWIRHKSKQAFANPNSDRDQIRRLFCPDSLGPNYVLTDLRCCETEYYNSKYYRVSISSIREKGRQHRFSINIIHHWALKQEIWSKKGGIALTHLAKEAFQLAEALGDCTLPGVPHHSR